MDELDIVGQVVAGAVARIRIREKDGSKVELGNLLVADEDDGSILILQVHGLSYGSQIAASDHELAAGLQLEKVAQDLEFYDSNLRNYIIIEARAVVKVTKSVATIPKTLPSFFASLRHIRNEDLAFLSDPQNTLFIGTVRSGSKNLDVDVRLNGHKLIAHHILIPATTGRGKSNLVKTLLWGLVDDDSVGILVLDSHDEYYGGRDSNVKGLEQHPNAESNIKYYSVAPPAGADSLIINLKSLVPANLESTFSLNDTQREACYSYFYAYKQNKDWIKAILCGKKLDGVAPSTIAVLQRKFRTILGLDKGEGNNIICYNKAFSDSAGESVVNDVAKALEKGKIVIIDTSRLSDRAELLIGDLVISEVLFNYQKYRAESGLSGKSKFEDKPVIGIVIEEAPRVIGTEAIERQADTVYRQVAREGRKFKIGLIAVTQLTSVIPVTILANMNTKIIFGNEMASERQAIIKSAAQDLSEDYATIGSLDTGEAIVSSIFTKFAIPIKVPLFDEYVKKQLNNPVNAHIVRKKSKLVIPKKE